MLPLLAGSLRYDGISSILKYLIKNCDECLIGIILKELLLIINSGMPGIRHNI